MEEKILEGLSSEKHKGAGRETQFIIRPGKTCTCPPGKERLNSKAY